MTISEKINRINELQVQISSLKEEIRQDTLVENEYFSVYSKYVHDTFNIYVSDSENEFYVGQREQLIELQKAITEYLQKNQ